MSELEQLKQDNQMLRFELDNLRIERETWLALPAVKAEQIKQLEEAKGALLQKVSDLNVKLSNLQAQVEIKK
jgi:hypothetical protein